MICTQPFQDTFLALFESISENLVLELFKRQKVKKQDKFGIYRKCGY